jgi:hypothetical protein
VLYFLIPNNGFRLGKPKEINECLAPLNLNVVTQAINIEPQIVLEINNGPKQSWLLNKVNQTLPRNHHGF